MHFSSGLVVEQLQRILAFWQETAQHHGLGLFMLAAWQLLGLFLPLPAMHSGNEVQHMSWTQLRPAHSIEQHSSPIMGLTGL